MMPLHCKRDYKEPEFDDLFKNCRKHIKRVDELHSDAQNDSVYVFIVWADDDEFVFSALTRNVGPQGTVHRLDNCLFAVSEIIC